MIEAEAVLLAAGAGSRFGGGKLLARYGHGVLLDRALNAALAAPVRRVLVVTGADAARVRSAAIECARAAGADPDRLAFVHADAYRDGLSASLRAGIGALTPDTACAVVFLADMPRVPPIAARLILAIESGAQAAAPVFDGRRGHPVAFASPMFQALAALHGDQGAGKLLDALGPRFAAIPSSDPGVVFDVDTPADLRLTGDTAGEFDELSASLEQGSR